MTGITIDGKKICAEPGATILEAARAEGINIPTLCYLKEVNEIGSCRLCIVEIDGYDNLFAACRTRVRNGMVIRTSSDRIESYRRTMLRLILSNHKADCMSCPGNGICRLQELCNRYGITESGFAGSRAEIEQKLPLLDSNPYITYDPSKCIHCQRCISACHYVAGNGTLQSSRTGNFHIVEAPFGENWRATGCESCGIGSGKSKKCAPPVLTAPQAVSWIWSSKTAGSSVRKQRTVPPTTAACA